MRCKRSWACWLVAALLCATPPPPSAAAASKIVGLDYSASPTGTVEEQLTALGLNTLLPPDFLQDAIVVPGDPRRAQALKRKVEEGKNITVMAFGSSITAVAGGCTTSIDAVRAESNCSNCCGSRMFGTDAVYHMSRGNGPGFAHGVADALRGLNPEVHVSVYNAGIPASGPDVLLSCIHNWLPARKRVDVFVFEYTVTLKSDNRPADRLKDEPMETLLRWALSLPSKPLVVFINFFDWCVTTADSEYEHCRPRGNPGAPMTLLSPKDADAKAGKAEKIRLLATHYGVGVVSQKDALYDKVESGALHLENITNDGMHPNPKGAIIARMMVKALIEAQLAAAPRASDIAAGVDAALPELYYHQSSTDNPFARCYGFDHPPERQRGMSDMGKLWPQMPTNDGWGYETRAGNSNTANKPGMVATDPGSVLVVQVDTTPPADWDVSKSYVSIEYLQSYEHMGTVEVTCEECKCSPYRIDSQDTKERHSLTMTKKVYVSQSANCKLRLAVQEQTTSDNHRFKLIYVAVGFDRR